MLSELTAGSKKDIINLVTGHKKEIRPGVWKLRVSAGKNPLTGKYEYLSRTVECGPRKADVELAKLVAGISNKKEEPARVTFAQLLDRWLRLKEDTLSAKSNYNNRWLSDKYLYKALGNIKISKLSAAHLDGFYSSLKDSGVSPYLIRQIHAIIRGSLNQAMKWGWLEKNVALLSSPPSLPKHSPITPSPEEIGKILEETSKINPQIARVFAIGALTGARRSEVLALRWSDFDRENMALWIKRSVAYTPTSGMIIKDTKTHSERRISIDPTAKSLISAQIELLKSMTEYGFELIDDPYLFFAEPDGSVPFHPDTPSKIFRKVCDKLGLPYHLHQLRHFTATQLIAAGVDVRTVSGRLGHSDPSITLRVYSHILEQRDRAAAELMGSKISIPD